MRLTAASQRSIEQALGRRDNVKTLQTLEDAVVLWILFLTNCKKIFFENLGQWKEELGIR